MNPDELQAITSIASDLSIVIVALYLLIRCENRRVTISENHLEDLRKIARLRRTELSQEETD